MLQVRMIAFGSKVMSRMFLENAYKEMVKLTFFKEVTVFRALPKSCRPSSEIPLQL